MPALSPLLLAAALLAGPGLPGAAPAANTTARPVGADDQRLAKAVEEILDGQWKLNPEWAFSVGYYRYAAALPAPDAAWRKSWLAFLNRSIATLAGFDQAGLSTGSRVDLTLLRGELEASRWYLTTFRDWAWQPSAYNVGDGFARMLDTEYAPLPERLRQVSTRLALVPAYYAAAQATVDGPTLEHTRLAIQQNRGALGVFGDDLLARLDASPLEAAEKEAFRARVAGARAAIQGYVAFLEGLQARLEKGGARSFRIGKALHDKKFQVDSKSLLTAEALYRRALAEKQGLLDQMELLARILWPKHLPGRPMPDDRLALIGEVIEALGRHHAEPAQFLPVVRGQVTALEAFVREHDLVGQDPTKPLEVREAPAYLRGVADVSVDAPGPYDPGARTWFNVSALGEKPAAEAESFLREYNDWMLQILDIHEAVPGHYVQLLHANRSPSVVKTLCGSGAMVEGWAVYAQRMMLEAGWGDNAPELWLMELKMELRVATNTILDREVHAGTLDRARALALLRREAFQSEDEANEKWLRVSLTQAQLMTYFDGFSQILALRQEERARLGPAFKLNAFHDRFLSYGNAPVKVIRQLMRE